MARPTKQGIEYFPLDTHFDDKTELFIAENGAIGLGVLITIWQLIYQNNGYYIDNQEDLPLLIKRRIIWETTKTIKKVISACLSRALFCKNMEKSYNILTSKAIQTRFFIAASRKKVVNVYKNYLLVDINAYKNIALLTNNVSINATNVDVEVEVDVEVDVEVNILSRKIITCLNLKAGTKYKHTTQKTKDLIQTRINEGFGLEDFKTVIDKKTYEWVDTDYEKFLRPETLFSNKFEGYLNQPKKRNAIKIAKGLGASIQQLGDIEKGIITESQLLGDRK